MPPASGCTTVHTHNSIAWIHVPKEPQGQRQAAQRLLLLLLHPTAAVAAAAAQSCGLSECLRRPRKNSSSSMSGPSYSMELYELAAMGLYRSCKKQRQ